MYLLASAALTAADLLGRILTKHYGLATLPPMECTTLGKPYFPDYPHIHFNLSHSTPYALCAAGEEVMGVDIEAVKPRALDLPAKVLTREEYRYYEEHGSSWSAFYILWTGKEAWCKRQGRGVARPHEIAVPLPHESSELRHFSGSGWVAAVCSNQPIPDLKWVDC